MAKKRILITDDENEMREEIAMILKGEGYSVVQAADGAAAMKILKKNRIDLMLLDLKMPVMNGFEVLKRMAGLKISVRTIVLTGSILGSSLPDEREISHDEKNRILKLADHVMNKPFDIAKLLEKIGFYISAR